MVDGWSHLFFLGAKLGLDDFELASILLTFLLAFVSAGVVHLSTTRGFRHCNIQGASSFAGLA